MRVSDCSSDVCSSDLILLDPGVEGGGPVAAWRDAMATPGKDMKVLGSPQLHHETIGDWPVEVMLRQVEDDGRGKLQAFFAIDLPARNELIVFEGSARDEETFNRKIGRAHV